MNTQFIPKSKERQADIFNVPEAVKEVCAIRISKVVFERNPNINMVTIPLHSGKDITGWAGVYGVMSPSGNEMMNPFSALRFTTGGCRFNMKRNRTLKNVKYVSKS